MATDTKRFHIHIWTDGSCQNPGAGGYAAIVVAKHAEVPDQFVKGLVPYAAWQKGARVKAEGQGIILQVVRGGEPKTTNNRMEMKAIIEGVRLLERPCSLTVHSDSTYAIGVLSGKLGANKNRDLVGEWKEVSQGFRVAWEHVNGHVGVPLNECADKIAKEELDGQKAATTEAS